MNFYVTKKVATGFSARCQKGACVRCGHADRTLPAGGVLWGAVSFVLTGSMKLVSLELELELLLAGEGCCAGEGGSAGSEGCCRCRACS